MSSHQHASSSNTVTTTQAGTHKRPRDDEGDSSTSNDEQSNKPIQQKRVRMSEGTFQGVSESGVEIEYQVPTSSQRDQDDPIAIISSDDEDVDDDDAMPDEGNAEVFGNDGIENYDMGNQEMDEGSDIDEIQSSANNEVEIEDLSEVPNQSSIGQSNQAAESLSSSASSRQVQENQQQIQSISSGTGNGNGNEAGPSTSGTSSSSSILSSAWRQSPNASTSRQQTQHLMLQSYTDDASDDRTVPSTPTLYTRAPRSDGFSEVVSSPHPAQVPNASSRVFFGESTSSTSSSQQNRPLGEGMDDTRIDLSEDHQMAASGRNVPNIPQQQQQSVSPNDNLINDSTSASTSSTSSSMSTVIQQDIDQPLPGSSSSQGEGQVPEICVIPDDGNFIYEFLIFYGNKFKF